LRLREVILSCEKEICQALNLDLGKSETESYMCEIGLTLSELSYTIKNLKKWTKVRRVKTPLAQFPARSFVVQEPFGVVLIMSPWNYPFLLSLNPLIGAIAAGNCVVLKPSAYSPETSKVLKKIISMVFELGHVKVVEGGRDENRCLLEQKFDYIFFTGGVEVGKLVMRKAAEHLTPVTLELGGKSPVVVDSSANLKLAARRIVFGKYLNCGQTCIAPDYILVEQCVKEELLLHLRKEIVKMYGVSPLDNKDYGKIINEKHFDRLISLLDKSKIVFGGRTDFSALRIEPTIMDNVVESDAVMNQEIFGPILPILTVSNVDEAYDFIKRRPEPLALYLFTNNQKIEKRFLREVKFGGGCVNDTIIHLATTEMGFGGIGNSGMGAYHGKKTFQTFSHEKSIVKKMNFIDLTMRYQPYKKWKYKLIRLFLK
jgi:aldehyde dehydrogenase (NAD+)